MRKGVWPSLVRVPTLSRTLSRTYFYGVIVFLLENLDEVRDTAEGRGHPEGWQ